MIGSKLFHFIFCILTLTTSVLGYSKLQYSGSEIPIHGDSRELEECMTEMSWKSYGGNIMLNGKPFHLLGANWFGFETETFIVHGIWGETTIEKILSFAKENKVNALRIPLSLQMALDSNTRVKDGSCTECGDGKAWNMLDRVFDEAAKKGILILLDMHRLNNMGQSQLWYDDQYSEEQFVQGWLNVLGRFRNKPNLIGIDLKNEPYGAATWGFGKKTDWNEAAERIVDAINKKYPDFKRLIFIEGVGTGGAAPKFSTGDVSFNKNWGQNLDGVSKHPIRFSSDYLNERIVYSPHVYGPSVAPQPYFSAPDFPDNMFGIWDKQIGFVEKETGKACVVGEWGGTYVGKDKEWQDTFSSYLVSRCLSDNFVWCINPNSGDTGGLLKNDWKTPEWGKLDLMKKIQPNPSVFTAPITDSKVCVDYGSFANPECSSGISTKQDQGTLENINEHVIEIPELAPIKTTDIIADIDPEKSRNEGSGDGKCNAAWAQCDGQNWSSANCCPSGYQCTFINKYYSQCKRAKRSIEESQMTVEIDSEADFSMDVKSPRSNKEEMEASYGV